MKKAIRLHWASSKPNFGDQLSPLICEYLSARPVRHASPNRCDLIAVGSILHRLGERFWNRSVDVWGTGDLCEVSAHDSKHRYHAVRGEKTAASILNHQIDTFGDPALLADRLIAETPKKKHTIGIVPHYNERDHPVTATLRSNLAGAIFIDVFQDPLVVLKQIASCHFILSSSLHGLVVADAFGVPNQWLSISKNLRGGKWKFDDYYSIFEGVRPYSLRAIEIGSLDEIMPHFESYARPRIQEIKFRLAESFPL